MEQISSYSDLQERIKFLELRTKEQQDNLQHHLSNTYNSLKPQNLIRNAFSDATASPEVRQNMISTSVGLLTGVLTNKLFMKGSGGVLKKLAGTALQFGVTKLIANNLPLIKAKTEEFIEKRKEKKRTKEMEKEMMMKEYRVDS